MERKGSPTRYVSVYIHMVVRNTKEETISPPWVFSILLLQLGHPIQFIEASQQNSLNHLRLKEKYLLPRWNFSHCNFQSVESVCWNDNWFLDWLDLVFLFPCLWSEGISCGKLEPYWPLGETKMVKCLDKNRAKSWWRTWILDMFGCLD